MQARLLLRARAELAGDMLAGLAIGGERLLEGGALLGDRRGGGLERARARRRSTGRSASSRAIAPARRVSRAPRSVRSCSARSSVAPLGGDLGRQLSPATGAGTIVGRGATALDQGSGAALVLGRLVAFADCRAVGGDRLLALGLADRRRPPSRARAPRAPRARRRRRARSRPRDDPGGCARRARVPRRRPAPGGPHRSRRTRPGRSSVTATP